ncbi:hypothetical protein [Paenibacillus timonensis]|uniref:hypothetical protein n=1 Tax=Paenibacillus timonensis TaxID=225915 RepID=UPI0022E0C45B|nr:hypothetical protein [Paenibacillus timonensis]
MNHIDLFLENYNKHKKETMHKECLVTGCFEKVIKAHSIQNNKILNKLSDNGEVMYFDFGKPEFPSLMRRIGRGKATTFTGFCSKHDTFIFRPIELKDYVLGDKEQEFLFAYRAFARAYVIKKSAKNLNERMISELGPGHKAQNIILWEKALIRTLAKLEEQKIVLYNNLINKKFNKLTTNRIVFDLEFSLATSTTFFLLGDLNGKVINDPVNPNKYISPFFLNVFPQGGKTYILMSYLSKDKHMYTNVMQQILNANVEKQKNIISNLIIINAENFVFAPDKFERLPLQKQTYILQTYNKWILQQPVKLAPIEDLDIFFH